MTTLQVAGIGVVIAVLGVASVVWAPEGRRREITIWLIGIFALFAALFWLGFYEPLFRGLGS